MFIMRKSFKRPVQLKSGRNSEVRLTQSLKQWHDSINFGDFFYKSEMTPFLFVSCYSKNLNNGFTSII